MIDDKEETLNDESYPFLLNEEESETDGVEDEEATDEEQSEEETDGEDEEATATEDGDLDPDELQAGYLRQRDYTLKTQELAKQREELTREREAISELVSIIERATTDQDYAREVIASFAETLGVDLTGVAGGEHASDNALAREVRALKAELNQLKEGASLNNVAEQTATTLMKEYKVKGITPGMVLEAMRHTGIKDPEAAFLKVHGKALIEVSKMAKAGNKVSGKPNTPPTGVTQKYFDPDKVDTVAEFMRLQKQGFVPKEGWEG